MKMLYPSILAVTLSVLLIGLLFAEDIYEFEELDEKPQLMEPVAPEYPEEARKKGLTGMVVVEVVLNEAGKVEEAQVKKSTGYFLLDEAAKTAAMKFEFLPAKKDGEAVKCKMKIPFKFELDKKKKKS